MADAKRKPLKIALIVVCIIIAVLIIAIAAINVVVRTLYAPFYEETKVEFDIPGISEGFVPQSLNYFEVGDRWLFSGYEASGLPSPIYWRTNDGATGHFFVTTPNGKVYNEHGSAVTSAGDFVYVSCEGGCYVLRARDVIDAEAGAYVPAIGVIDLGLSPAFMSVYGERLYAGEFFMEDTYPTDESHHITTPDGSLNSAIMYEFMPDENAEFGFSVIPNIVYSLPDKVQGICITSDGRMMLSTSWGLASSHLLVYDAKLFEQAGTFRVLEHEIPLYCLDSQSYCYDIIAPPMTEGLDLHDGSVYIAEESASNLYIFGKLYHAGVVRSLEF